MLKLIPTPPRSYSAEICFLKPGDAADYWHNLSFGRFATPEEAIAHAKRFIPLGTYGEPMVDGFACDYRAKPSWTFDPTWRWTAETGLQIKPVN